MGGSLQQAEVQPGRGGQGAPSHHWPGHVLSRHRDPGALSITRLPSRVALPAAGTFMLEDGDLVLLYLRPHVSYRQKDTPFL